MLIKRKWGSGTLNSDNHFESRKPICVESCEKKQAPAQPQLIPAASLQQFTIASSTLSGCVTFLEIWSGFDLVARKSISRGWEVLIFVERDVRPRPANRAAQEMRTAHGNWGEGALPQGNGNPRRREQCSARRCTSHRKYTTTKYRILFFLDLLQSCLVLSLY